MKSILTAILLFVVYANTFAQKPSFKPLLDPKSHAGCYMESGRKIIANLSEEDSLGRNIALFNLFGKDESLHEIKGSKKYPAGYGNENVSIFIQQTATRKEPNSCLEYQLYKTKLVLKKKTYFYTFRGFCGC